jgi:hypothetical protein
MLKSISHGISALGAFGSQAHMGLEGWYAIRYWFQHALFFLSYIQWNFSKPASIGTNKFGRFRGVAGFMRLPLQGIIRQGLKKSADIQGGPVFWGSGLEKFYCTVKLKKNGVNKNKILKYLTADLFVMTHFFIVMPLICIFCIRLADIWFLAQHADIGDCDITHLHNHYQVHVYDKKFYQTSHQTRPNNLWSHNITLCYKVVWLTSM